MENDSNGPELHVVAGCLFEVSLPEREGLSWRWAEGQPEVTQVGESVRRERRHFRFRAEAAGPVALRFRTETEERGTSTRMFAVSVAPEQEPAG
jgi:hypothetical protein